MDIGVVGLGIVGGAVKFGFERLGHNVIPHDIRQDTRLEDTLPAEIIYLCVPTPYGENGQCDTSIVEQVVGELADKLNYGGVIAIKSTLAPGTTEKLQKKYPKAKICHVPEFLRERVAIADFTDNHDVCIIGTDSGQVYEQVKLSHGPYPREFVRLSPTEAELAKYFHNVYNATLITLANGFYDLSNKLGANYTSIKNAIVKRDHITDKYLDCNPNFRGFGGVCLPKDTAAIAFLAKKFNLPAKIFETVLKDNDNYTTTVLEGMRP